MPSSVRFLVANRDTWVHLRFFDYRKVTPEADPEMFEWRGKFNTLCAEFKVKPAEVCVQFSFLFPEIVSVALATSKAARVASNVTLANAVVPEEFWVKANEQGLINVDVGPH